MLGKLDGAQRANKTVRVATHMTAARYETNLRLPFRVCRKSDMYLTPLRLSDDLTAILVSRS